MKRNSSTVLYLVIFCMITSVVKSSFIISCKTASNNTDSGSRIAAINSKDGTKAGRGEDCVPKPMEITEATKINALEQPKRNKSARMKSVKGSNNIMRWAIHGVATELFHNIVLRTFYQLRLRLFSKMRLCRTGIKKRQWNNMRQSPKREIAVVTGATGGIGSQIAHELAFRGYDVVIAARDIARGEALAADIRGLTKDVPINDCQQSSSADDDDYLPTITFVEYHADDPQSARRLASSVKELRSPMSILINNAGIMGQSKQLTMRVNLLGPAYLTFALLPLMTTEAKRATPPTVINVGSSAHLRATHVLLDGWSTDGERKNDNQQSWINSLPDVLDSDLSTYASSKLALMQFSTILRQCLPVSNPPIRIFDAHPGLVWTSLLRNHIGDRAVKMLTSTGLANVIYKSSAEGAHAIISALDYVPPTSARGAAEKEQVYFVNGMPGGYASPESASFHASLRLWKYVLQPELNGKIGIPENWESIEQKIETMKKKEA